MPQFVVSDMTCGHCVSTITKALKAQDSRAEVEIVLDQHLVKVESTLSADEISASITKAGYTPQRA
jgi:copper chaperone